MDELVLHTDRLTKRYGTRLAVDAVSMTVRRGEVYGFLGPNGAGKTTTLRMALGLVRPTSGAVRVLGGVPGDPSITARVGALIEGPGFFPYLSGRANLQVLARYRGLPAADVDAALERVDLADRGGDRFKSYSLGMKQRLGVAAALLGEPELIMLDEPTNGLDPGGMADMRRLIVGLAADGQTVILSSHLLAEVEEICSRVGVISRGRLLREARVDDLRGAATLVLDASPLERALQVSVALAGPDAVRRDADRLVLDVPPQRAPELVRALVAHDVDVREITPTERSLEEVFFEMTDTHIAEAESARVPEAVR